MDLVYPITECTKACRKAETMYRAFDAHCVVVRRRVGTRDSSPQGYVILTKAQATTLALNKKEYVTVYDTELNIDSVQEGP